LANVLCRVVEPPRKRVEVNMFIDVDALLEQMRYIQSHVADLKTQGGQDRTVRYFTVLHDLLLEMNDKVRKHKSVRLDFWGQP
jgi:hypothetical protein